MSDEIKLTVGAEIYKVIVPVGDVYLFTPDDGNRFPFVCLINDDGELAQTDTESVQEGSVITIVFDNNYELPTEAHVIPQVEEPSYQDFLADQVADGVFAFIMPSYDVYIYGE